MGSATLGPGPEFDRIRAIARAVGPAAGPLDDDCALLPDGASTLALSIDVSVELVHFRRDWLALEEIGWRAAAAALSDLAGEGAEAIGLLTAVTAPRGTTAGELAELMRGVGDAAAAVGGRVLGGDLTAGPVWSVAVTVVGRAARPVTRAGARPGDGVWVTGSLGGAAAALAAWLRGDVPEPAARRSFAHPVPRIEAGRWLAARGATAMLDVSDGLAGDAAHLAAASGVELRLELDRLPVAPAAAAEAGRAGVAPAAFAARGGEDYELLVTLPAGFDPGAARSLEADSGLALTRIGDVSAGAGARLVLGGTDLRLDAFDHFR